MLLAIAAIAAFLASTGRSIRLGTPGIKPLCIRFFSALAAADFLLTRGSIFFRKAPKT
jgi:hypothetical protein